MENHNPSFLHDQKNQSQVPVYGKSEMENVQGKDEPREYATRCNTKKTNSTIEIKEFLIF